MKLFIECNANQQVTKNGFLTITQSEVNHGLKSRHKRLLSPASAWFFNVRFWSVCSFGPGWLIVISWFRSSIRCRFLGDDGFDRRSFFRDECRHQRMPRQPRCLFVVWWHLNWTNDLQNMRQYQIMMIV